MKIIWDSEKKQNTNDTQNTPDHAIDKMLSGLGWGLVLLLAGGIILALNVGWLHDDWGRWALIGFGGIYLISFLVRYFGGHSNRWKTWWKLIVAAALLWVGLAYVAGIGTWWPVAFIPVGVIIVLYACYGKRQVSTSNS